MEAVLDSIERERRPIYYAGFWRRFVAYIIDFIIISIASGLIITPILSAIGVDVISSNTMSDMMRGDIPDLESYSILNQLISLAIWWAYFALMESSDKQGTIGKIALGIAVTDMDGERVSLGKATVRHFGKILSSMILLIGFIMAAFTSKKQALHDMLANALVVKR